MNAALWTRPSHGFAVPAALIVTTPAANGPETTDGGDEHAAFNDSRVDGLVWTFVRIRYRALPALEAQYQGAYGSAPRAIDFPAAEHNLTRRVRTVTALEVADPMVLTLKDPQLWQHPWAYFVEPGTMNLTDSEAPILREFLLGGGTATFDDFRPHRVVEFRAANDPGLFGSTDGRARDDPSCFPLFLFV